MKITGLLLQMKSHIFTPYFKYRRANYALNKYVNSKCTY